MRIGSHWTSWRHVDRKRELWFMGFLELSQYDIMDWQHMYILRLHQAYSVALLSGAQWRDCPVFRSLHWLYGVDTNLWFTATWLCVALTESAPARSAGLNYPKLRGPPHNSGYLVTFSLDLCVTVAALNWVVAAALLLPSVRCTLKIVAIFTWNSHSYSCQCVRLVVLSRNKNFVSFQFRLVLCCLWKRVVHETGFRRALRTSEHDVVYLCLAFVVAGILRRWVLCLCVLWDSLSFSHSQIFWSSVPTDFEHY